METKFKKGDEVKIVFHQKIKNIGKAGIIKEVIPVFSNFDEVGIQQGKWTVKNDSDTTGFYKISVNGRVLPDYAKDDCLKLNKE